MNSLRLWKNFEIFWKCFKFFWNDFKIFFVKELGILEKRTRFFWAMRSSRFDRQAFITEFGSLYI